VSLGLLSWGYALATIVPIVALSIRRIHDVDRSGWWLLAVFVPLIGAIALIGYALLDGTPGDNRYGPDPKGTAAEAV